MTSVPYGYCQCGCGGKAPVAKETRRRNRHVKGEPMRFIRGHSAKVQYRERFSHYTVRDCGYLTPCWLWNGVLTNGYGRVMVDGHVQQAHRVLYEQHMGPIPEGMSLDHLCHSHDRTCAGGPECRHRRCVNPEHLEPVSLPINVRRGRKTKLDDEQVEHVRARLADGVRQVDIAREVGVGQTTVSAIKRGLIWSA